MPIFKKKAAKREAAMDQKKDSKSDLAMAVATSRFAKGGKIHQGAKEARKYSAQESEKGVHAPRYPYPHNKSSFGQSDAGYQAEVGKFGGAESRTGKKVPPGDYSDAKQMHREKLEEMRSMKKPNLYAEGGEVHCHDGSCYADGGMVCGHPYSIPEVLRCKFMAAGGLVSDPHDQIEHSNYFDELNQDIANEPIYEDDVEHEPRDSNEMGDKLADEDAKGKSIFKKIKMKKAQPGDRGNY